MEVISSGHTLSTLVVVGENQGSSSSSFALGRFIGSTVNIRSIMLRHSGETSSRSTNSCIEGKIGITGSKSECIDPSR